MLDYAHLHEPGILDPCREPSHLKDKARNLGLLAPEPPRGPHAISPQAEVIDLEPQDVD